MTLMQTPLKTPALATEIPDKQARLAKSNAHSRRALPMAFYAAALVLSMTFNKNCLATVTNPAAAAVAQVPRIVAGSPLSADDRDFLAARDAYDRRDLRALDTARTRFGSSTYPLTAYVDFWWHSANIAKDGSYAVSQAKEIGNFLDFHPDTPFAETLRRDWLKALGAQDAWETFATAQKTYVGDDSEVTCYQWRYRLNNKDRDSLSEIRAAWNAGRHTTENCYATFIQAAALQPLTTDEVWTRARLAFERNQLSDGRRIVGMLNGVPGNFDALIGQASANPAKYLATQKLSAKSRASVEPWLLAVTRQARDDPARAAELLAKHGTALGASDRAYAWAQVGLYGAMQHEPNALAWFANSQNADVNFALNDNQAAWKARASLRAGEWAGVRSAIEAMSTTEQRESAWRYWLARARQEAGNAEAAKVLREGLARENNFYGVMAAEELGVVPTPNWQGYKPSATDIDRVAVRPGIQRALTLYKLDMKPEALREWQSATRGLNDQDLLAASAVARQSNAPDRAINAAERTVSVHDFSQRFPMPHRSDLQPSAKANRLDEAWVYGLIRQESRFMADARSRVGAMGLMQLMPATARWVAKQNGMKEFSADRAIEVPVNLSLGSFYLRHVLDDVGHPVLATAAYNAGPGRARRWRAPTPLEGAIYAESIPFSETRDYVKKVMANSWFYANQMGMPRVSLREMMGTVPAKGSRGKDGEGPTGSAADGKGSNVGLFGLGASANMASVPMRAPASASSSPAPAPTANNAASSDAHAVVAAPSPSVSAPIQTPATTSATSTTSASIR
jgi:soluble lytic murein transglycosylase